MNNPPKNGITIGSNTQIGSHCSVYSYDSEREINAEVIIGKGCLIGSHCVILPDVVLPDFTRVPAMSMVYKKGKRLIVK